MWTAFLALTASAMLQTADEGAVVCLENTEAEQSLWVALGEKYATGKRDFRQLEIAPGRKACVRYEGLRNVVVTPLPKAEADRRLADRDLVDPWRVGACERISRNDAVFLQLSVDAAGGMRCEPDTTRPASGIRALAAPATPFRG